MLEEIYRTIEDLIDTNKVISSIDMGCDKVQLYCTTGKIKVWFGKHTNADVVRSVLTCFSKVDSSFVYEKEIICNYDQIRMYEDHDYVLVSYGKADDAYRVIFNIQFSKHHALNHFIETIIAELQEGEVNKTFHWNGSIDRIFLIYYELKSLKEWDITKIEYREEE
jgi:hypothetical protein